MGNFGKQMLSSLGSAVSGVAGGFIGSAGSKLIDSIFGSDPNKQNKELMQMQNQFNALEAQKNRDFQLQMFNKTNEYNSPKAQMQRLMEAGLNPDLMYGSNGQSFAAQSPSGSQASGVSPVAAVDMQQRAANVALTQAQARLADHQADNLDADTNKKGAETAGILTYNEFQKQLLQGQIDLNGIQIKLGESAITLNEAQQKHLYETITKIQKEVQLMDANIDEIKAKISNLDADTALKKIQEAFEQASFQPRLDKLASEIGVNKAQATHLLQSLVIARCGLELQAEQNRISWMTGAASADLADANSSLALTQQGVVQFDFDTKKGLNNRTLAGKRYIWETSLIQAKTLHECVKCLVPFL